MNGIYLYFVNKTFLVGRYWNFNRTPFYDAVNMIHDVITTPDPFPYTAKLMFVGVSHNKKEQIRR